MQKKKKSERMGGACEPVFACRRESSWQFLNFFLRPVCLSQESRKGHTLHLIYSPLLEHGFLLCFCRSHFLSPEMYLSFFPCKFFHSLNFWLALVGCYIIYSSVFPINCYRIQSNDSQSLVGISVSSEWFVKTDCWTSP